ncbi:TonB-dependent receptor domain-containing protein [Sphingomonas albertensis]|uniref:TonB-dependent receptor n=1 Tax=Sphingomonas albertensis TaxID=2762591 RepID=A0ABR7AKX5_9SPHN|nr:TonB-dependent receptor [Sphingomonas albertensis]MBC3941098.1 TonB-dependent receptor [Sphingomonas albertensis]
MSADEAGAETFDVPAGRLGEVAAALGSQAGITITVTDPGIAVRRSPGVRGRHSVRAALARALRGTGTEGLFYDAVTVRIVSKRVVPPRPSKPRPGPVGKPPEVQQGPVEIVVTASKQDNTLNTYPGTAMVIEFRPDWLARNGAEGTGAIAKILPALASTNLGPGRDKLFVRGIADSSFNGPTQATVSQYLGNVRLNYNAPDPDLNLYDMKRVEVLAGPQGTLYGGGSLGGVIRLVPSIPDGANASATAAAGLSTTGSGGIGADAAAMINLPISGDRIAVRAVVHAAREAGYIDDPSRDLKNINSTRKYGARLVWRFSDIAGWTVDLGGVFQNIVSRDGQYVLHGDPPLTRANVLSQPFRNDYRLVYLDVRRAIGSAELVSTTSVVRHDLSSVFDATGHAGSLSPAKFEERSDITLIAHETRIAGGARDRSWVAGLGALHDVSRITRTLGTPDAPAPLAGVRNLQAEFSLFGQASQPVGRRLVATVGGRLTIAGSAGQALGGKGQFPEEVFRNKVRFSPTIALDWRPAGRLTGFLRYQQGYRAGGLAASSGSTNESRRFEADDLTQIELGVRWGKVYDPLSVRAALFLAEWNHIQADLIGGSGLPYTANIGNGRIYGLDGEIRWRLSPDVTVTAAAFLNDSRLRTEPVMAGEEHNALPNIARDGVRVGFEARTDIAPGINLTGDASMRYVGKSQLGPGPLLGVSQGEYLVAEMGGRLAFGNIGISLDISNLGDVRANTFAYGNPYGLGQRDQVTPLRPRTIRLGIDTRF